MTVIINWDEEYEGKVGMYEIICVTSCISSIIFNDLAVLSYLILEVIVVVKIKVLPYSTAPTSAPAV